MMGDALDPASVEAWIARGRDPAIAVQIAAAWRDFPDLPTSASLDDRKERMRERAKALKPAFDAMSQAAEAKRQADNFACTERQIANGKGDARDRTILDARDAHGYDWDHAIEYAYGHYAATAGWIPRARRPGPVDSRMAAYDRGFADGGGNRDDLFDTARRALAAAAPSGPASGSASARPTPSTWLKPTDRPRPARWDRRLLLLGAPEAGLAGDVPDKPSANLLSLLQACPEAEDALIIIVSETGFARFNDEAHAPGSAKPPMLPTPGARNLHIEALRELIAGRDIDDVLVAAQGAWLAFIDAHAAALPLCRAMERTCNSVLQQRAHFRIWLDRGMTAGQSVGAGHIRWGKAIRGLTGKLGEFTARYGGKDPARGHRIIVETGGERPAEGYVLANGEPLAWESFISNRAHLRGAMAARLRAFGGATRLANLPRPDLFAEPGPEPARGVHC